MTKRKTIFGAMIALVWLMALAPAALAQDTNRLSQLKISVWPEYDTSTVLVLLDGTLADKTNLPRQVSVLIPSAAKLTVTTFQNADGTLAPEQPNQTADDGGGYSRVTFTINQPNYRVEYYHDLLKGAPDKSLDFALKLAVPSDQVTLEIQQPLKASNFVLTPPTTTSRTDTDGFKYYSYQLLNVTAGQVVAAQAKYTKTDPSPSIQAAAPSAPATSAPAASSTPIPSSNDSILLLAGLVSLGLVGILGFFLYQRRARDAAETTAQKMSPRQFQRQRKRARGTENASVFCTKCGSPMDIDDNFCPKCGVKRRAV